MDSNNNRRMRGFKRWMKSENIEYSDALIFPISSNLNISVKTLCDLHENDVIATIPKHSCLTVITSAASFIIEESHLGGYLALSVAIMYEKSLGPFSKWFQYIQLLPPFEPIPLLWSLEEIDLLLVGTELHKVDFTSLGDLNAFFKINFFNVMVQIIKEDKGLVYKDWKECIEPLLTGSSSVKLNPEFFTVDEYLAAKSLIASRSFEIDEYHGSGMVPLADLFNHKTAGEDVHFTAVSPSSESDIDTDFDDENKKDNEPIASDSHSEPGDFDGSDLELSFVSNGSENMEMIIVKDVKAGVEVFNTYGSLGNAALLHRYGFTEPDNPFDVVNIDLEIVIQWSLTMFSSRHSRRRLAFWRKADYSGCVSENSEYFEVSFDGEPQGELLVLLYVMILSDESYDGFVQLFFSESCTQFDKLGKENYLCAKSSELNKKSLLRQRDVRQALLSIADAREAMYGQNTLQDDMRLLKECCRETDRKLYHSLWLRISERRIIAKLRSFATCWG